MDGEEPDAETGGNVDIAITTAARKIIPQAEYIDARDEIPVTMHEYGCREIRDKSRK